MLIRPVPNGHFRPEFQHPSTSPHYVTVTKLDLANPAYVEAVQTLPGPSPPGPQCVARHLARAERRIRAATRGGIPQEGPDPFRKPFHA